REKRRLIWARVFSRFCESRKDGANKVFDSALNTVITGAIGFCAEAIRGASICPAAAWLVISIPSSRIKRLCITRFPGRLILAFHPGGEGTDFASASKFLRKRHGLGIRTSLCEEPDCQKRNRNQITKVGLRLSVPLWTLLDLFQFAQTFDSRSVILFLCWALIFQSLQV